MEVILFLIGFPFLAALISSMMRKQGLPRRLFVVASCSVIIMAALVYSVTGIFQKKAVGYLTATRGADLGILVAEILLTLVVVIFSFRYKKYYVALLSLAQTGLMVWLELFSSAGMNSGDRLAEGAIEPVRLFSDKFTVMTVLMIGIVGSFICVYAVGYMKEYHQHHTEVADRSGTFFALLFVFMGAMFGLVFSNSLAWMYFFWEITSLCSFLLIGYTKTNEAMNNAFRALWMNLLGGLGFAAAIAYSGLVLRVDDLQGLLAAGEEGQVVIIPLVLLALAAMTKSAQMPFSGWLLGAMVAPTPTSALLHSATMVKAGVYLLLRLSPLFAGNLAGTMVTSIGGFTFLAASALAISQSDAKKVLAYSTISNLGLIVACAGIGMHEAAWAGILLMLFHAVSKSLMFLSVGAVENTLGSRNIEDMHGLIVKLPFLAFIMITGIAGMFLAPFGMLISKWAALKAFIDSDNLLLVVFVVFGSATTLFYWTKWLGKLMAVIHNSSRRHTQVGKSQWLSMLVQAFIMIALCLLFPLLSTYAVEPFLSELFHDEIPAIISQGNLNIMLMMLVAIVILPIGVRFLTFNKKKKIVMSYMGGGNAGDDRHFTDSFGKDKEIYLANWYMEDYFGEKKILLPSTLIAVGLLVILSIFAIGGAL